MSVFECCSCNFIVLHWELLWFDVITSEAFEPGCSASIVLQGQEKKSFLIIDLIILRDQTALVVSDAFFSYEASRTPPHKHKNRAEQNFWSVTDVCLRWRHHWNIKQSLRSHSSWRIYIYSAHMLWLSIHYMSLYQIFTIWWFWFILICLGL